MTTLLLTLGAFSDDVARRLGDVPGIQTRRVSPDRVNLSSLPVSSRIVLVTSAPAPEVETKLSEAGHRWGVPMLPVVLDGDRLRVGPWTRPNVPGCSACYLAREAQHAVDPATDEAVRAWMTGHPESYDQGFLPTWSAVAAGILRAVLAQPVDDGSRILFYNTLHQGIASSRLVPVHGCRLCRPRHPDPLHRSVQRLEPVAQATSAALAQPLAGVEVSSVVQ